MFKKNLIFINKCRKNNGMTEKSKTKLSYTESRKCVVLGKLGEMINDYDYLC